MKKRIRKKRGKTLTQLLADIEEIDRKTRILDKQRVNRVKRILDLLQRNGKTSVIVKYKGERRRITRVAASVPTWNQAGLKSYLREHSPDAVKIVFPRQEVFDRTAIDKLLTDELISEEQLAQLQEFCTFRENAPYPRVSKVRDE